MNMHKKDEVQQALLHEMTRVVAWATLLMVGLLACLLVINMLLIGGFSVLPRLLVTIGIVAVVAVMVKLSYGCFVEYVAWLLVGVYGCIAASVLYVWGVNIPFGLLMLSLVIALAGVMLGSRAIVVAVLAVMILLVLLQMLYAFGIIQPNLIDLALPPSFGDVAGYCVLFGVIAASSWLSRNHMERSLARAITAEKALQREKDSLARRLDRRTQQLRQAQIEEMRQLHRFADLGQMSAALLHELANHLAVVTLSIDDLERQHRQSRELHRAKESINDLEGVIAQMREHLNSDKRHDSEGFNVLEVLNGAAVMRLVQRAQKAHVALEVDTPKHRKNIFLKGDRSQFEQVVGILCVNAIEAYEGVVRDNKSVSVVVRPEKSHVVIDVVDYAEGVDKEGLRTLFEPHASTKRHGMGIGLFLARQIVESHFKGNIRYARKEGATTFSVIMPLMKQ